MPYKFQNHKAPRCEVGRPDPSYDERRYSDPVLARSARIRNSAQWQKVRAIKRARSPVCADPYKVHPQTVLGESIHHILPLEEFPELAFVDENLANTCWYCHNRADAEMRTPARRPTCIRRFITPETEASLLRLAEEKRGQTPRDTDV